jgi:dTDP-4-amino-4,6-dideoxygalactose transaminase
MFHLRCRDLNERSALIEHLKSDGIMAVFHYIPLHSAEAGQKYSRFNGEDSITTQESERLLRLPLYYGMTDQERHQIVASVRRFYA